MLSAILVTGLLVGVDEEIKFVPPPAGVGNVQPKPRITGAKVGKILVDVVGTPFYKEFESGFIPAFNDSYSKASGGLVAPVALVKEECLDGFLLYVNRYTLGLKDEQVVRLLNNDASAKAEEYWTEATKYLTGKDKSFLEYFQQRAAARFLKK